MYACANCAPPMALAMSEFDTLVSRMIVEERTPVANLVKRMRELAVKASESMPMNGRCYSGCYSGWSCRCYRRCYGRCYSYLFI